MGKTVGATAEGEDLDEGTIHDVLRNARRRLVIEALQEREGSASVSDLAEAVAAKEAGTNPAPKNKRQSVYVSLHRPIYFGWSLLGVLVVIGVQIGVPLLATIGVGTVAIAFSLGLMATAAFHVYTHQNRILFQRLLK